MKCKLLTVLLLFLFVTACAPKQVVKPEEQPVMPPAEELKLPDADPKQKIQAVQPQQPRSKK